MAHSRDYQQLSPEAPPKVMKITHNVALNFIQFLFRLTSF